MATPAERAMWFPDKFRTRHEVWHFVVVEGRRVAAFPSKSRALWYRDVLLTTATDVRVVEREISYDGSLSHPAQEGP